MPATSTHIEPTLYLAVPVLWMLCFAGAAIVIVDDRGGFDVTRDGIITIRDVAVLLGLSWVGATGAPAILLLVMIIAVSHDLYAFLELEALTRWSGAWGISIVGLAGWILLFVGIGHAELAVRQAWRDRRGRR